MSPTPRRQAVLVGLFVLVGAALLGAGILTVGDLDETFGRKAVVHTTFADVNGLTVGGNVWYSGVKVGTVRDIRFGAAHEVEVDLAIEPRALPHIPSDVRTKVGADALLGNKIVVLYEGEATSSLQHGDVLEAGDVLTTDDMLAMVQQNNANLLAITADLKLITADLAEGRGSAGLLVTDDTLYEDLVVTVSTLRRTSGEVEEVVGELSEFSAELNREGNLPHEAVTDRATWSSVAATTRHLEESADHANALVARLDHASADPATPLGTVVGDPTTAAALRDTLANLDRSSRLLAEDLEALQHNLLLRGYFKRRARRAEASDTDEPSP